MRKPTARHTTLILVLFFSATCSAGNLYTCRTEGVYAGERCWAWFPKGGNMDEPPLPEGWTWRRPAIYSYNWHNQWAWEIQVAKDASPGTYQVGNVAVTVLKKDRVRPLMRIGAPDSLAESQRWLDIGYDIELLPGLHYWNRSLNVPDGATIRSAGAWIIREPNGEYGERMFMPQGGFTLDGLVLTHAPAIASESLLYVHQNNPRVGPVLIRNCTLRGGNLSQNQTRGWVVERCIFERAGTGQVGDCMVFLECEFRGATRQGHHPFFNTGVPCLVCSCTWDRTTRGMIFQTGPVNGAVVIDCKFRGIHSNGLIASGEVILLETGPGITPQNGMHDNLFVDILIDDCSGPGVALYGSGMHDNAFWGINANVENVGLSLCELGGGSINNTMFQNVQTTGGVDFRGNIGTVELINVQFIECQQLRGNSGPWKPIYEHYNTHYPIYADESAKTQGIFHWSGSGIVRRNHAYEPIHSIDYTIQR